jgi:hypothetical protein
MQKKKSAQSSEKLFPASQRLPVPIRQTGLCGRKEAVKHMLDYIPHGTKDAKKKNP